MIYLLLSPTFGMHQYTADLANRMVQNLPPVAQPGRPAVLPQRSGRQAHLITSQIHPADRYAPDLTVHTPVRVTGTGFAPEGLSLGGLRRVVRRLHALAQADRTAQPARPLVHFTGVHLWNPILLALLRRRGVSTIHTLHDLEPHHGVRFAGFIRLWNRAILAQADHILVHGRCYRDEVAARGLSPQQVTYAPLLHGFWGAGTHHRLEGEPPPAAGAAPPMVLFFGRIEAYKGASVLLAAWEQMVCSGRLPPGATLLLAGPMAADLHLGPLPPGVELRDRRIDDEEGIELFRRCSLLVLPYIDATQSALVAAAYYFAKPVIVTRTGALPEYVVEGETGWVVPPNHADGLAAALHHALADPERLRRMGAAGRRWYTQQRQLEEQTLEEMYQRVAGGS